MRTSHCLVYAVQNITARVPTAIKYRYQRIRICKIPVWRCDEEKSHTTLKLRESRFSIGSRKCRISDCGLDRFCREMGRSLNARRCVTVANEESVVARCTAPRKREGTPFRAHCPGLGQRFFTLTERNVPKRFALTPKLLRRSALLNVSRFGRASRSQYTFE